VPMGSTVSSSEFFGFGVGMGDCRGWDKQGENRVKENDSL